MLTPSHNYLIKRRQSYYYRRRVPVLLKAFFTSKEFVISLQTKHFTDAKKLANRYDDYFAHLLFQEKIKNMDIDPRRIHGFTTKTDSDGSKTTEFTPEDIKALSNAGYSPEQMTHLFQSLTGNQGSPHSLENTLQPDSISTSQPTNPNSCHALPSKPLLSKVIEDYHDDLKTKEQNEDWEPSAKNTTFFRRLTEIIGDKSIYLVDRDDAKLVTNKLKLLPSNSAKYRDNPVNVVIELSVNEKKLSSKTINDHLELYSRLFTWAKDEIDNQLSDPFNKLRVKNNNKKKANQKRNPFSRIEISNIFATPIYSNPEFHSPYKFWTPLIALHSGARRAEIASLYIEDIYKDSNDIWVFDFNENTPDKKVKTINSIRKTPIHPFLIDLGFLDFVASCKQQEKKRLFEDLENWTEKEGYGRPIGDWFNLQYLKDLKIYIENKKVFYSFRHTFATELNKNKVDIRFIEQLSGREINSTKSVGEKTYIDDASSIELLEQLKKLDFSKELNQVQKWPDQNQNPIP